MNVFVLCPGRCGSTTFAEACRHITNYSTGHETRAGRIGAGRLAYPDWHIEVDNRLSWFLGRLDLAFGDRATYVHLSRDPLDVAASFVQRYHEGIIGAYNSHLLMGLHPGADPLAVCLDYVWTVTANIEQFLRTKSRVFLVRLETIEADFRRFWGGIGATGDLGAALAVCHHRYNATC